MSCGWSRKSRLHNWYSLDLPRDSHKNFQDLDLWPGIYCPTSILNRKACLSCVNIYLNMHSKFCWTKCCQHLDRMFNMLLIDHSFEQLYVLICSCTRHRLPQCLTAQGWHCEHRKHPVATRKDRKYLKTGVTESSSGYRSKELLCTRI